MDVGELLELERALEGRGIVDAAPEEEEVPRRVIAIRERSDLGLLAEHRIDEGRQMECLGEQLARSRGIERSSPLAEVDREKIQIHEHRGVGLRRRDADLRSRMQIHDVVGHATRLTADHVHERQKARALLLRLFHRGKRVGCLSRLRDRDHELTWRPDRLAISVFTREVHVAGYAREALDEVLADKRGVGRGAARDEADPRQRPDERVVHLDVAVEDDSAARALDTTEERVRDRAGLLENLLQQEMLVSGLRRRDRVPGDLLDLLFDRLAAELPESDRVLRDDRELAVVQEAHRAGASEAMKFSPFP